MTHLPDWVHSSCCVCFIVLCCLPDVSAVNNTSHVHTQQLMHLFAAASNIVLKVGKCVHVGRQRQHKGRQLHCLLLPTALQHGFVFPAGDLDVHPFHVGIAEGKEGCQSAVPVQQSWTRAALVREDAKMGELNSRWPDGPRSCCLMQRRMLSITLFEHIQFLVIPDVKWGWHSVADSVVGIDTCLYVFSIPIIVVPTIALSPLHSYTLIKSMHAWLSSRYAAVPHEKTTLSCPRTQEWQKLDAEYVAQQLPASTRRKSLHRL